MLCQMIIEGFENIQESEFPPTIDKISVGGECLKTNALLAFAMIHTVDFDLRIATYNINVDRTIGGFISVYTLLHIPTRTNLFPNTR